jgi:hypothetical protein
MALSGFEAPALVTVAEPLIVLISPITSFARADVAKRTTSIRMKKQSPCLVFLWVKPDVGMFFTMVIYLLDGS